MAAAVRRARRARGPLLARLLLLCLWVSTRASNEGDGGDGPSDEPEERTGTIIGIDLGTTYSCVGVFLNGRPTIIPNDQGNRITPSYVAFTEGGGRLIGDAAKNQAAVNPRNTVFDVKRLIGRRYSDRSVQEDMRLVPYDVVEGSDGRPYISVSSPGGTSKYAPEEVSAMVLGKLRADAERYLGRPVGRAVVTVPAYFNDAQRHSTRDAGVIAGLAVERIINEPTAAAIAYGIGKDGKPREEGDDEENVLVFDLGGGTFDVTLLTIDGGIFEVLATNGDTHLGGSDVDHIIMSHFMETIRRKDGRDISSDRRALQKLRRECERVKRALSGQLSARLDVEDLVPGYDFTATLTRAKFEELTDELFRRTLVPVKRVLEDAMLDVEDVHQVILVGGSTRIPRVRQLITDFFGREPNAGVNPDESVAVGAAIQGAILSGEGGEDLKDLMLLDVLPLSLGTDIDGGLMSVIIKRGTTIPTESSSVYHTLEDNQKVMNIDVYEGERPQTKHNHLLGEFQMTNLPPLPRGRVNIKVTLKVDADGLLEVTAENLNTKDKKSITITAEDGRLSEERVEEMVKEAERHAESDRREAERLEARNRLESHLYRAGQALDENEDLIDAEELKAALDLVDETKEWLEGNPDGETSEFERRQAEVDVVLGPITRRVYESRARDGGEGADDEL